MTLCEDPIKEPLNFSCMPPMSCWQKTNRKRIPQLAAFAVPHYGGVNPCASTVASLSQFEGQQRALSGKFFCRTDEGSGTRHVSNRSLELCSSDDEGTCNPIDLRTLFFSSVFTHIHSAWTRLRGLIALGSLRCTGIRLRGVGVNLQG